MAEFDARLLRLPAGEGAAWIARAYLDDAADAAARLHDRRDTEALHDFRVAIRRLRVAVSAYPALRDAMSHKQRRRLRTLAHATNAARDAEVQLAWLNEGSSRFSAAEHHALAPLRARIRARRRREEARTREKLEERFKRVSRKLRRGLAVLETTGPQPRFAATATSVLMRQVEDLRARLSGVTAVWQVAELHAARIAAKKLRYLLEPLREHVAPADPLVDRLRQLQDLLGEIHDAHVLSEELDRAGISTASERLAAELQSRFAGLKRDWLSAGQELQRAVRAVIHALRPSPSRPHAARRRDRLGRSLVG